MANPKTKLSANFKAGNVDPKTKLSANFKAGEFMCPCCKELVIDERLIAALEAIRSKLGRPLKINSGYRCEAHNAAVGGERSSKHTLGLAADFTVKGISLQAMSDACMSVPALELGGIGLYPPDAINGKVPFVHVDVGREKRARWSRVNGKYVGFMEALK